jgi:predicted double-glycine peptidase
MGHRSRLVVGLPPDALRVPVVKQTTDFSCGAAATLSVLRYWRRERYASVDETALHAALETTEARGTEPEPIVRYLREAAGLEAVYRHGDVTVEQLVRAVDARQPPIVDLQAWDESARPYREVWDAGHYVVLIGHDAEHFFFMDPSVLTPGAYAFLPRGELEERWHDLSGDDNARLQRMAIFVKGDAEPWMSPAPRPAAATRLR